MGKVNRYPASGFHCLSEVKCLRHYTAAAVTIVKGDWIHDDGNGYGTNTATAFAVTGLGVAAHACTSGQDIAVIPLDPEYQFIVPVDNALATQTAVGSLIDLGTPNNTVSLASNPTEGIAFMVDEIDVSAEAVAINTYGFVIGHFVNTGTEAGGG